MPKAEPHRSFILAHTSPEGHLHAHRVSAPDEATAREKLLATHNGHIIHGVHDDDGRAVHAIGAAMVDVADLAAN